ncbi:MAG: hypothetical protein SF182_29420, partial [Deltaproteobacteria bacterium]|nr:hypothetical protein [Deltaproteobacteria bacterium]
MSLGIGAAVAMLINGAALAVPLPGADQKCIDGYNNFLRLVSAQAGKSATSCIKNASKGKEPNPDNCIVANTDGKIAGKRSKVSSLFGSKCTGSEPIQTGATNGNDAHQDALEDLAHDYFGDPVSGVVSVGKQSQKCLQKAIQRPTQAFTELVKAHRKCKKNEMKAGNVVDSATLDTFCGTFALIDGANGGGGKVAGKYSKATTDVTAACAGTEETLASLFSGLDAGCHASPAALAACLNAGSKCRACLALNDADGQDMDCDTMDDGAANGSCGGYPAVNIGTHACTLNGAGSSIALTTEAFPIPPFSATGTISLAFGAIALDGTAAVNCNVVSLDPVVIPGIGDVCVNPYAGCASGQIDCDGGAPQDVDLIADHTIGACVSNAACSTACDAVCAGIGPTYTQLLSGCEGKCQGGAND